MWTFCQIFFYACLIDIKLLKLKTVTTVSLLEELLNLNECQEITVVSQYTRDLKKIERSGITNIQKAEEFYPSETTDLSIKNVI